MARRLNLIVLIFATAAASALAPIDARGQAVPDAPGVTTSTAINVDRVLMYAAVASIGVDAYATHVDWTPRQGISTAEVNPIARPFVSHGTAPLVAYFAAGAGAFVFAHHKLAHRHPKLALALDLVVMGSETYYTQYSFRHHIE